MFGKHSTFILIKSPKNQNSKSQISSDEINFENDSDIYGNYLDSYLEIINKENQNKNLIKKNINKKEKKKIKKTIRLSELQDNNLYNILNIDENSTQEEIKKAYKKLVIVNHPDKGGDALKFNKINEAYQILSLPLTKQIYDRFGCKSLKMIRDIINENKLDCDSDFCNIYEQKDLENLKYFFQNDD